MKMLLGLVMPTSGRSMLLGAEPGSPGFPDAVRRVGALIEAPALYERLSARRDLELQARSVGVSDAAARIGELLDLVDLSGGADDPQRPVHRPARPHRDHPRNRDPRSRVPPHD